MRIAIATSSLLVLVTLAACAAEDGGVQGPKAKPDTPGVVASQADAGGGTTWTDLYRDFFGPTAPASCAGSGGACHGAPGQSGARVSGYVCATRDGCRASMLSADTGLVQESDFAAPEESTLVTVLRRRSATGELEGTMPKGSSYELSHDAIARIEAWIRSGAPDD